jgi:protein-tyrosine kinase
MSRVHDALRRVEQREQHAPEPAPVAPNRAVEAVLSQPVPGINTDGGVATPEYDGLQNVVEIPFRPAPDAHLISSDHPEEAPGEEFRSLRTRLNHLQSLQPVHVVVVTSPSPAEGKSFTAANLALAQSFMANNLTLLADFDFRRPAVHKLFQTERSPGISDYLMGKAPLNAVIRKIEGTNLCIAPAGSPVKNPLEILNLPEARTLFELLPNHFNWVVLDSPPLLFSADANLISTMTDGTILVVRLGNTTVDSITRAMQSLCENNVLGIVVNGARAGELYSKYTYYYARKEKGSDKNAAATAEQRQDDLEEIEDES